MSRDDDSSDGKVLPFDPSKKKPNPHQNDGEAKAKQDWQNATLDKAKFRLEHLRSSGRPALPQGSSFRFGLFCPDPSSLIRPHPPHSRAQLDFAAKRLIRVAIAVRHGSCL